MVISITGGLSGNEDCWGEELAPTAANDTQIRKPVSAYECTLLLAMAHPIDLLATV